MSKLKIISQLCLVCGDRASGCHYGVQSCDGCRGFFKRAVRSKTIYQCKESGDCIVDKQTRNRCQACRFKACLAVNMNKNAVQSERNCKSASTPKATSSQLIGRLSLPTSERSRPLVRHPEVIHKASNPCTYASHAYQPYPRPSLPPFVLGRLLSPLDHMLHAVQIQHIHHVHNEIKLQHFQNFQISEIQRHQELPAVHVLKAAVEWLQSNDKLNTLSQRDVSHLIAKNWCPLLLLTFVQLSVPINLEKQLTPAIRIRWNTETQKDYSCLVDCLKEINNYELNRKEFSALKELSVFQSADVPMKDSTKVESLRDQAHLKLVQESELKADEEGTNPKSQQLRPGKLLLLLNKLNSASFRQVLHLKVLANFTDNGRLNIGELMLTNYSTQG